MVHACYLEGVVGYGNLDAKVAVVGIAPGQDEWRNTRKPFTGSAGRLLDATLKVCGWSRDEVFTTNLICWWKNAPDVDEIAECWPRLFDELKSMKQLRLIVACGAIATEWLFSTTKWSRKSFTQLRGGVFWHPVFECWIMSTYHPAAFLYEDSNADVADFGRDLYKVERVVGWPLDSQYGKVEWRCAETAVQADIWLADLEGLVAIDVETTYDNKHAVYEDDPLYGQDLAEFQDSKLLCFSVTSHKGTFVIPGHLCPQLNKGWGSNARVEWLMHGGMFDQAKLRLLLGEELVLSEDTLLMSYSVDERGGHTENEAEHAVGIHGLKQLAREYCGADFYDVNVLKVGAHELHEYNACDTAYDYKLFPELLIRQERDGVRDTFYRELLIPASNVLSECQEYGAYIDRGVIGDFAIEWCPVWLDLEDQLVSEARAMGWPADKDFNLKSSAQMIHFVYDIMKAPEITTKANQKKKGNRAEGVRTGRTTNRQAMDELAEEFPWCEKLRKWRNIDHLISAYISGIEDDIKWDGRVHPEPLLHGTRPGRMSYHKPPVQTIPNKGVDPEQAKLRRMFAVKQGSGKILLEADFKQAEFWACYLVSRDENLLEELLSGDIHGKVAEEIFHVDKTYEHFGILRFLTKVTNFGILYGRQAQGFVDSMWRGHQPPPAVQSGLIKWDFQAAKDFIHKWELRHPRVVLWRKEEISKALKEGEQITVTGRKRRYWMPTFKTLTQSINFVPQSTGHDHLLKSLIDLHPLLKEFDSNILFEVHDALVIEVEEQYLDEVARLVRKVMERPKFGFDLGIPVDIKVGYNWYDMEEYQFAETANVV